MCYFVFDCSITMHKIQKIYLLSMFLSLLSKAGLYTCVSKIMFLPWVMLMKCLMFNWRWDSVKRETNIVFEWVEQKLN